MIKTETIVINGTEFLRTYSDEGFCIKRDEVVYEEAVDPLDSGREYTETDEMIYSEQEATDEDYQTALEGMGVEFHD